MASVYDLKPAFQAMLRPFANRLAANGVTANQVTVSALLLSVAAGGAVLLNPGAAWPLLLLPPVLLVRMALNALDGMLAREHHQQSRLGAVLNELGDVVADIALYLPLVVVPGISQPLVVGLVLLAVVVEFVGVQAIQIGSARRYDGPFGKSDRALLFGTIALFIGLGYPAGSWLSIVLATAVPLSLITLYNRVHRALAGS